MRLQTHSDTTYPYTKKFNKEGGIEINFIKYYCFKTIKKRRGFEIESFLHLTDDYPLIDETIIQIFALIL